MTNKTDGIGISANSTQVLSGDTARSQELRQEHVNAFEASLNRSEKRREQQDARTSNENIIPPEKNSVAFTEDKKEKPYGDVLLGYLLDSQMAQTPKRDADKDAKAEVERFSENKNDFMLSSGMSLQEKITLASPSHLHEELIPPSVFNENVPNEHKTPAVSELPLRGAYGAEMHEYKRHLTKDTVIDGNMTTRSTVPDVTKEPLLVPTSAVDEVFQASLQAAEHSTSHLEISEKLKTMNGEIALSDVDTSASAPTKGSVEESRVMQATLLEGGKAPISIEKVREPSEVLTLGELVLHSIETFQNKSSSELDHTTSLTQLKDNYSFVRDITAKMDAQGTKVVIQLDSEKTLLKDTSITVANENGKYHVDITTLNPLSHQLIESNIGKLYASLSETLNVSISNEFITEENTLDQQRDESNQEESDEKPHKQRWDNEGDEA